MNLIERAQKLVIIPFKPSVFRRPPHSEEVVRSVLNATDCTQCGQCCQGHCQPIPATPKEIDKIRRLLTSQDAVSAYPLLNRVRLSALLSYLTDHGIEVPHGQCVLAENARGKSTCSVYGNHPSACQAYPFNPVTSSAFSRFDPLLREILVVAGILPERMIGFTAHCPPIMRIAEQGVPYLLLSDITNPVPSFLTTAINWLNSDLTQSQVFLPQVMLEGRIQPFIPLLNLPVSLVMANALRKISGFYPKPPQETP